MKLNIGDIVEFKTASGIKTGVIKRKEWYTLFIRVKFSKWFFKTYKVKTKDVINVDWCRGEI